MPTKYPVWEPQSKVYIYVLVDKEDTPRLNKLKWYFTKGYAYSVGRPSVRLSSFLLGTDRYVRHRDLDRLNYQKDNLQIKPKKSYEFRIREISNRRILEYREWKV